LPARAAVCPREAGGMPSEKRAPVSLDLWMELRKDRFTIITID
jgi:hypothetical protein